ncbi:MAG: DUF5916 domain-containing protein [Candidatus Zixiibacteriota bacterium]|jgi:hypothetical protein
MKKVVVTIGAASFLAAITVSAAAPASEGVTHAVRVETPPVIDGVLEDMWFEAEPASAFRQYRPAVGEAAFQDTEVYVLYDDKALYFAFVCYEDNIPGLTASATVRDMYMNEDDAVNVMLDANNDRQSAYDFIVNWRGVRYDGSIAKDGWVGGSAWDGYWEAAATVGEDAWYCEMALPWSAIHYDRNAGHFGIQFLRFRQATYENTFWASDGQFLNRVSTFGRLEGLENLPRPKAFEFTPYVTGRAEDRYDTPAYGLEPSDGWEFEPRYGLDARYRIGSTACVLATVLPDYAYIEADPAQINLSPSELYLDEKRPFFTEGYELFDTPGNFLYTRRLTEIAGGLKVKGQAGPVAFGALDVLMRDDDLRFPEDNVGALRARYDFESGSSVGLMGVGRRERGDDVPAGEGTGEDRALYNNVGLVDGSIVLPARFTLAYEGAASATAGEGGDDFAYTLDLSHYSLTGNGGIWFNDNGEDFRADTSFLQPEELGRRQGGLSGSKEFQINRGGIRSVTPDFYYVHDWDLERRTVRHYSSANVKLIREDDFYIDVFHRGGKDLRYVASGYPAFYNDKYGASLGHRLASWGSFEFAYWRGPWYGDYYHGYYFTGYYIPFPAFVLRGDVDVANPRAGDRSVAANLKTTHNLTDELFWRIILQGNSAARTSSGSVLWGWDFLPGSTAYVAYEQRRDSNGRFLLAEQVAFVKISYMISV